MPRTRTRRDPVEAMNRGYSLKDRINRRSQSSASQAEPQLIYQPSELMQLVVGMNADGGAVLFGVTSEGGVLTVILYLGEDREVSYIRHREEWLELLQDILGSSPAPSSGGAAGSSSQES